MKRLTTLVAIASAAVLAATPALAAPGDPAPADATQSYIVQFSPGADRAAEVARAKALGMTVTHEYSTVLSGMSVTANAGQLRALQANPNVTFVEPDGIATISDTQGGATWGIDRADQRDLPLSTTYSYSTTSSNVTAYVIDTGILTTHAQFGGRARAGYDAVTPGGSAVDCNGHGTHVSGTIGGSTYGMAKGVSLVAVRVLDCSGSGSWSGVIAGIDWAANDHKNAVSGGAEAPAVANMSLGGGASSTVDTAVANLVASGVTVAVAAGNDNRNACNFSPARVATAITVGATTSSDSRASYSNFGSCLDIFAPGSGITSSWIGSDNQAINTISGTSMATPHVAGAAALYLAANPTGSPASVASVLASNATPNKVGSAGTGSPNRLLFVDGGGTVMPPSTGPTITGLSQTSGPVGTSVTISGTNLSGAAVTYNGVTLTPTSTGSTSITVVIPSGATSGTFTVTTSAGFATSGTFTVTTTPSATAPAAPTSVVATQSGSRSIQLSWTPGSDGGSAVIDQTVIVYLKTSSGTFGRFSTLKITGSGNSINLSGFSKGSTYRFTVSARNAVGSSPDSTVSNEVTMK